MCVWYCTCRVYMEESLIEDSRTSFVLRESGPFRNIIQACRHQHFLRFLAPYFLTQVAESCYHFMILYTRKRFHW